MKQHLSGRDGSRPGRPGGPLPDLTTFGLVTLAAVTISLALMAAGWRLYGKRGLTAGIAALCLTVLVAALWRIVGRPSGRSDDLPDGTADRRDAVTVGPGPRGSGPPDQRVLPPGHVGPSPPAHPLRPPPGPRDDTAAAPRSAFPVVRQRSRIAAIPWRLPVAPSPSGLAADQGRVGNLDVRAASLVGPAHRCGTPALPRQDAYRLGQDTRHDHLIVAVADGMSDSKHSDVGANVAAGAVVSEIRTRLDQGRSLDWLDASDILAATAGQMIGAAEQRRWSHDDVRCALAVAVMPTAADEGGGRRVWLAALADVTVWLWQPGGWRSLVGDVKEGADAGQLDHYLPYHPEKSATRLVTLERDAILAVTTDGIGDAISMLPGAAAWFAERWRTPRSILSFVSDIGYEDIQFNDDRTAVVIWCGNGYPGR
jgi:hypothetical protein